jgi:hypothetical protein
MKKVIEHGHFGNVGVSLVRDILSDESPVYSVQVWNEDTEHTTEIHCVGLLSAEVVFKTLTNDLYVIDIAC